MRKRTKALIFLPIILSLVLCLVPNRLIMSFFCPLFYTPDPIGAHGGIPEMPSWRMEKNYIDQYGNLWLFDREVNQIAAIHIGMHFFIDKRLVGIDKVHIDYNDKTGEAVVYYFSGPNSSRVTLDPDRFYSRGGHEVLVNSGMFSATVFEGTDYETHIPLAKNKLLVGTDDDFTFYDIPPNLTQKILVANNMELTYESAMELISARLSAEDREAFLKDMKSWEDANPVD